MVDVYIGIGSNIEPEKNFREVYLILKETYPSITFSRTFKSVAVGFVGDDFYNSVAKLPVEFDKLDPPNQVEKLGQLEQLGQLKSLLTQLKSIEKQIGRARGDKKFSARVIDIDVLLFGDLVCEKPTQLPRDEILHNAYVLWPLSEISPDLQHPVEQKNYSELWKAFDKQSQKLEVL